MNCRLFLLSNCKELSVRKRVLLVIEKEAGMPVLAIITLVLVSPFMAISLLPTLRNHDEDDEEETIVRWRK